MKCIIADAGPIIALCKVRQLDLLNLLFKSCFITDDVYTEVIKGNDQAVDCLKDAVNAQVLIKITVNQIELILEQTLDKGEASAITLAKQKEHCALLIDEIKGREMAKQLNIPVIGTAGLLLLAKRKGFIDEVLPILQKIKNNGYWLSTDFLNKIAKLANEKKDK